jgi:hypothetical protein
MISDSWKIFDRNRNLNIQKSLYSVSIPLSIKLGVVPVKVPVPPILAA